MAYTRVKYKHVVFGGNSANFSVPYTNLDYYLPDTTTGSKVERWRKLVKSGDQAGSNYSRESYILKGKTPTSATCTTHDNDLGGAITPNYATEIVTGYPAVSGGRIGHHASENVSAVDGRALVLLYKKIREETSHMNGLQFFGELRESLRMIKRPAAAIREGLLRYDRLLKNRKKSIPSHLPLEKKRHIWKDMIAGTWLEVSFGWKPLVQDTQAIAETIGRTLLPDRMHTRARAYVEDTLSSVSSSQSNTFHNSTTITANHAIEQVTIGGVQYIVGLRLIPYGPTQALERIRNLSGITLENFVPTLYELTPWSFLLDYFTNVGDIINSAFTNTANVTWQIKSTRLQTTRTVTTIPGLNPFAFVPPYIVYVSSTGTIGGSQMVKSTFQREVLTHLDIPSIEFRLPGSATKYANIAALMSPLYHQRFRF